MRDWLIQIRKRKGITQHQVASQAFIERSFYAQIERGQRNPSFDVAKKIADVLNFDLTYFYTGFMSEPFELALRNAPVVLAHCDTQLRYTWIYNSHGDFQLADTIGKRDDEIAPHTTGIFELMVFKRKIMNERCNKTEIITFGLSDGPISYHVFGSPLMDAEDRVIGVSTVSTNVSSIVQNKIK